MAPIVVLSTLSLNRSDGREVLECGGWGGTGLAPLWLVCGWPASKRCVPPPLTHRTPKRWRAGRNGRGFKGARRENPSGSSHPMGMDRTIMRMLLGNDQGAAIVPASPDLRSFPEQFGLAGTLALPNWSGHARTR